MELIEGVFLFHLKSFAVFSCKYSAGNVVEYHQKLPPRSRADTLLIDSWCVLRERMPSPFVGTESAGTMSSQVISNKLWHQLLETKIGVVQLASSDGFDGQCLVEVSILRRYSHPLLLVKSNRQFEASISQGSSDFCKLGEVSPGKTHLYFKFHLVRKLYQFLHLKVYVVFHGGVATMSILYHLPVVEST
jgi:hypothetical protein